MYTTRLPIRYKPKQDEIFSSWLARICLGNVIKPHSLNQMLWPKDDIWTKDFDKYINIAIVESLSQLTGVSKTALEKTLLSRYKDFIYENFYISGRTPWVRELSKVHREAKAHGRLFCPLCLKEDKTPYYRIHWRTALSPCCLEHKTILASSCPNCSKPINYYRINLELNHIAFCQYCNTELSDSKPIYVNNNNLITFLEATMNASTTGKFEYENIKIDSLLYFPVIRKISILIFSRKFGHKIQNYLQKKLNMEKYIFFESNTTLETISPKKSVNLFVFINHLLSNYPWNFVNMCKNVGLTRSLISHDLVYVPFWFDNVLIQYISGGNFTFSYQQIESAVGVMKKRNIELNIVNFRKLIGRASFLSNRKSTHKKNYLLMLFAQQE